MGIINGLPHVCLDLDIDEDYDKREKQREVCGEQGNVRSRRHCSCKTGNVAQKTQQTAVSSEKSFALTM